MGKVTVGKAPDGPLELVITAAMRAHPMPGCHTLTLTSVEGRARATPARRQAPRAWERCRRRRLGWPAAALSTVLLATFAHGLRSSLILGGLQLPRPHGSPLVMLRDAGFRGSPTQGLFPRSTKSGPRPSGPKQSTLGNPFASASPPASPDPRLPGQSKWTPWQRMNAAEMLDMPRGLVQRAQARATKDMEVMEEMPGAVTTGAGVILWAMITAALIYGLADDGAAVEGMGGALEVTTAGFIVIDAIVEQALPNSIPDAAAIAFAEGFAGILSSAIVFLISIAGRATLQAGREVMLRRERAKRERAARALGVRAQTLASYSESMDAVGGNTMLTEAVANADYFYANTAARATLSFLQVPGAEVAAVLLAQLPYQAIKLRSKMEQGSAAGMRPKVKSAEVDVLSTRPTGEVKFMGLDGVDVIADVIKWLEFDVLVSEIEGENAAEVPTGMDSAAFGAIAALSSQIYRDGTLAAGYGSKEAREDLANRKPVEWIVTYSQAMVSSALLFGTYETLRKPLSQVALSIISGGAVSCWGSADVDMCLDVYTLDAVPSALLQALMG